MGDKCLSAWGAEEALGSQVWILPSLPAASKFKADPGRFSDLQELPPCGARGLAEHLTGLQLIRRILQTSSCAQRPSPREARHQSSPPGTSAKNGIISPNTAVPVEARTQGSLFLAGDRLHTYTRELELASCSKGGVSNPMQGDCLGGPLTSASVSGVWGGKEPAAPGKALGFPGSPGKAAEAWEGIVPIIAHGLSPPGLAVCSRLDPMPGCKGLF